MLLPSRVEASVAADAMVRVIDAFVAGLETRSLGFERAVPAERGWPGFDPRDMLRLCIFGSLNGVRSSGRGIAT